MYKRQTIDLKTTRGQLEIVGVYAPEQGKREETERFYKQLQKTYDKIKKIQYIVVAGDLNARICNKPINNIIDNQ